jgi:hypothetical protein
MSLQLLSGFNKRGIDRGLFTMQVDIEDTAHLSKYFEVVEFAPVFTAGKNSIAFNGSNLLKDGAEIKVQCIDSNGNNLYLDYPRSSTQYTDIAKFVVAIHVYNEIYNGAGKLALVGTTAKNEVVRWIANISIDKTLNNVSKTRFQSTPTIEARSLLYNVISGDIAPQLTSNINFTGSCFGNAITPQKDTIKSYINPKKTETDYRITFNSSNAAAIAPTIYPTESFNSQMEGQAITLVTQYIQEPFSYKEKYAYVTASFKIKKVLNSNTLQVDSPFFFSAGKDQGVTNINIAGFTSSYKWVAYNTALDAYSKYTDLNGKTLYQRESYAEILYRNLTTFTGFVARHKLYRKSMLYPGDYQLIADEPLTFRDLLVDPVTSNKTYNLIGNFYNQCHIDRYWFTSSAEIGLSHSVSPRINSMTIDMAGTNYKLMDGSKYVIAKMDATADSTNDCIYYPYDQDAFNKLSGSHYYSNFIDLKSGSLYVISTNLTVEKSSYETAKIEFYLTSSISDIVKEKYYIPPYGWKLGEIQIKDQIDLKIFADKQYIYFTPLSDYYGTLVIVPYLCKPTFSELSIGIYGDYGFSPDASITKVPFKINVANEPWQLRSELYDINSTLVYSNLQTVQTFDINGESLFGSTGGDSPNPNYTTFNATIIPSYNINTNDYLSILTSGGEGRALSVRYIGDLSQGRRIEVRPDGTKYTYQ